MINVFDNNITQNIFLATDRMHLMNGHHVCFHTLLSFSQFFYLLLYVRCFHNNVIKKATAWAINVLSNGSLNNSLFYTILLFFLHGILFFHSLARRCEKLFFFPFFLAFFRRRFPRDGNKDKRFLKYHKLSRDY